MKTGAFDLLTPDAVIAAIEGNFGVCLDGTLVPYPSYINRVFGVRTDGGESLIAKFYRPGRWSFEAILEEHDFLNDCAEADIPVVQPFSDEEGDTLFELNVSRGEREEEFAFGLFPKRAGRNFDAEGDEDWFRLGGIVGRIHLAGKQQPAPQRTVNTPGASTAVYVEELLRNGLVHPDHRDEFASLCGRVLERITPLFEDVPLQRIHGDCHRGNILDRPGEGLIVIDFDDMMTGPPVQDLWLLLPGYAADCRRELVMMLDGYEQFLPFDRKSLILIEPLRFMRMIYYLTWCARQRSDFDFRKNHPHWGSDAFWAKELEDLKAQEVVIRDELDG